MRILRRLLRYLMMTLAVIVVVILLGIGYTQTGWFKDWLRRYIVREAAQYLNGELSIGRVSGSLFYGIRMSDIALVQDGETVIALKDLKVDYSAFRLVASGIVLDEIELNQPVIRARRTADGWNLMRLVKRQARERQRTGPGRPIALSSIVIHDGRVRMDRGQETGKTVGQQIGQVGGQVPAQVTEITDLDVKAAFAYQPVRFTIDIANVSFRSSSPTFALSALSGKVAVAGEDVHIDGLVIRLPETELKVNGLVRDYKKSRQLELQVDSSKTTFREIGVLLPVVRNMAPQPSFRIKTSGPLDRLDAEVDLQTREAGTVRGKVTLMLTAQPRRMVGDMQVAKLNLAPWLNNPQTAGLISGRARFDLHLPDSKKGVKFGGTYHFVGPEAGAYGYAAEDVDARGRFEGTRVEVAQARALAYGVTATGTGVVDGSQPGGIRYEFKGRASNVDMRRVPKQFSVPALESRIDMNYDLAGRGRNLKATAVFHPSVVEGANIGEGMRGHFELNGRDISYGGEGHVEQLNLRRIGRALDISALDAERFDSAIGGNFRVEVSGRSLDTLVLDADGVVSDSTLLGTKFPEMAFRARIDRGALEATAKGAFEGFNPTVLIDNEQLAGTLTGTVDGKVTISDLRETVTLRTFGFDGQVNAKDSTLFDLSLASAFFDGKVGDGRAEVRQLTIDGPDIAGTASGTMALDDAPGSASDLTYRFTVPDLARLGKRLEQPFEGRAELGGKVTGNFAALETTGTAHLEPARYGNTGQAAIVDATYKVRLPDLEVANVRVESHVEATNITLPPGAPQPSQSTQPSQAAQPPQSAESSQPYTVEKLSADVTYEKREVTFNGTAIDDGRTMEARGSALLQDGRQEVRLASASLTAAGITWRTRDNAEALIVHDGATVNVTGLQVVNGEQQVMADGVVGVKKGTPSTLKLLAENVDLAQAAILASAVDPKMKPPDPRMAGRLSANARVTGTLQEPAIAGTFSVVDGAFRDVKYQSFGGQISYDDKRIGVDVKLEQSPGTALTARGSLPLSLISGGEAAKAPGPEEVVDLHVQSTPIDLGLIQGLTTAVTNVTGQMQLDMRVKGRGRDVAFEGFVKVDQGAFAVTSTGARYTGLNTSLQFEPSRLVVDGLSILDDGNDPLELRGVLGLTGTRFGTLDLTARAKAFELLHNDLGEVEVNMDLKIGGEIAAPQVGGTVEVERGRVEVDRLLRRLTAGAYATESEAFAPAAGLRESAVASIPSTRVPNPTLPPPTSPATPPATAAPGQAATQKPAQPGQPGQPTQAEEVTQAAKAAGLTVLNRMRVDIRASIPDNLVLRGKDLRVGAASMGLGNMNVTVGGDLRVMRQPGTPTVVVGSVNTVRGSYDYRGRRFDILRDGRITFQGPRINDPALDVTGQRTIEPMGVEARVHIEGTAQRPRLRFSSNPPMDESDVIALIIFNRPLSDLESGERGAIAEVAGSAVGGLIVSPLADTIGRALNLDVFEVGTTSTETGGTGGAVTVGKQIDDNLFFRFRQQFGSQEVSEFILEYQLARFLRLQAAVAEGEGVGRAQRSLTRRIERAGLDLIFYFSY